MKWITLLGVAFAGLFAWHVGADEPKTEPQALVVTDGMGKQHKVKEWKLTTGTRHLGWLAGANKKAAEGPHAIEFRELDSTKYADGVLTLVPVDRARELTYDMMKESVKFDVATGPKPEDKATLSGSIEYKGINRLTVEVSAEQSFLGGEQKTKMGINGIKFPGTAKVEAHPMGRPAIMTTRTNPQNRPTQHKMTDIKPLYRIGEDTEVLSPVLYFSDNVKADMAKVVQFKRTAATGDDIKWVMTLGKNDETLTLLPNPKIDGKDATLIGFIGNVPAGYKFFPAKLVAEIEFDAK
jgi:hypothetical protein